MSVIQNGPLFSIGGFAEFIYDYGYRFTDASSNDISYFTDYPWQNIVMGTKQNDLSALRITSNEVQFNYSAYVGECLSVGTSNVRNYKPAHRLVLEGPSNSAYGAHWAAYVKGDPLYPLYQQRNNKHDDVSMSFDSYWTGSNWQSSSGSGNFQIKKYDGRLLFHSACNVYAGQPLDQHWYVAMSINSNSFVGMGTSNATHRLTMRSPAGTVLGPHVAYYIDEDPVHPLVQQLHWNHDEITYGFDCYWDSNNWVSSSPTGNVQVKKQAGRYMIHTACNTAPGAILDNEWRVALTANSNSFLGIGTSNVDHRITIEAEDSSPFGPHTVVRTLSDAYPLYQQLNWSHDRISQAYDSYFQSNAWVSSSATGNFVQEKFNGRLVFNTACNAVPGSVLDTSWRTALSINSNSFLGIGTSNVDHRVTMWAEDSSPYGPHVVVRTSADAEPLFQQLNWRHDKMYMSFDSYFQSNAWVSSSPTGNFQLLKTDGRLVFNSACNMATGSVLDNDWRVALSINSNSYVGIGTSNPTHRLSIAAEDSTVLGPHIACYTADAHALYQQLNWTHNRIVQSYDSYWDSNSWVSSDSNANFQVLKTDGRLVFNSACNMAPGSVLDNDWRVALSINSNSYVGIGTSNPTHRLSLSAEDSTVLGPHIACYTADAHALYQQLNWTHNRIVQSYDSYWDSNSWVSSDSNANFQVLKTDGRLVFNSACNMAPGSVLDNDWRVALAINSNSYVGIGTSNPTHRLSLSAEDSTVLGPHIACYTSDAHALYQQLNWTHNRIVQSYDSYWDSNNWVSSDSNANFQVLKTDGRLVFNSACNMAPGSVLDNDWRVALSINSNSYVGIGTSNPTHRLNIVGEDSNIVGPHMAFSILNDPEHPLYQQLNLTHDSISQTYDGFWNGNDWTSSHGSGNFQLQKLGGQFLLKSSCNNDTGSNIAWRVALATNSNSFIGIGGSNQTHRITVRAEASNLLGPHAAYYVDTDPDYPVFEQRNWEHDSVSLTFDAMYVPQSNLWVAGSLDTFQLLKNSGRLHFQSACNHYLGETVQWSDAFVINSNSFLGIKTADPTHRITVRGEDSNLLGPHVAYYLDSDSNNPVYQHLNWSKDSLSTSYDCYWDGVDWVSSSATANFRIHKEHSRLNFYSACNMQEGTYVQWHNAMTVNSNSFVGMGTSNPVNRLTVTGPSNDLFGPHVALCYTEDANPTFQMYASNHDNIALNFGCYNDGFSTVSSTESANFQIVKERSRLMFRSATFGYVSSNLDPAWRVPLTINSNSYIGIHNSNPEMVLDVAGETIMRSNLNITGSVLPNSNMQFDLGSFDRRFKDLWLSGDSLDMEGLKLKREPYSGGLHVYDWVMDEPARVWAKEILVGNPADLLNSNVFLIVASSNGLQLKNVTSNLPPQPYSQLNNMYVTQMNVGIGVKQPEKSLQVVGDVEINPNDNAAFFWDNLVLRLEQHDLLDTPNAQRVPRWGTFDASNSPTYYKSGGYNDSPYIECRGGQDMFVSTSNIDISAAFYYGCTALVLARFNRDPQADETLFSFSNNGSLFQMGRNGTSQELRFETKEATMVTSSNLIVQNQWTLFAVRHLADSNMLSVFKDTSNVGNMTVPFIDDMSFVPGVTIGNGNIDISSLYVFDRALPDDELLHLSKKIIYPGHKSFQIRTYGKQYPPKEFFNDTPGWNPDGRRNGGQVYSKRVENVFYGNGTYRVWANTELQPSYQVFDNSYETGWSTATQDYNTTQDAAPPPALYIETPFPLRVNTYTVAAMDSHTSRAPYKWTLYGNTGNAWMPIDSRDGETMWASKEERTYYLCNAVYCRLFKLEVYRNDSYQSEYVAVSRFVLYGDENQFVADGTGVGINTAYPREALTVDGSASITNTLSVGRYDDTLKLNLFEHPPSALSSATTRLDAGTYVVSESSYYQNDQNYSGYRAFDGLVTDGWAAAAAAYNALGNYVAASATTTISGVPRQGEWLQLELPGQQKLAAYEIWPRVSDSETTAPNRFYLAGSQDSISWEQVDFRTYYWPPASEPVVFYLPRDSNPYSYYRLVVNRIGSSASSNTVVLTGLSLYAKGYERPRGDPGSAIVRGSFQATRSVVVGKERQDTLFDSDASLLGSDHVNGSVCQEFGRFSSDQFPVFLDQDRSCLYVQESCSMDAGTTELFTSRGFTCVVLARLVAGTTGTALLCCCNDNTDDNQVFFGKTANNTVSFVAKNGAVQCFNVSSTVENERWHVYSARYDPASGRAEVFVDRVLSGHASAVSPEPSDRTLQHAYINRTSTQSTGSSVYVAALLAWDSSLVDEQLDLEIDRLLSNVSMYVQEDARFAGAIKGDLEIRAIDSYSTPDYPFPPAPMNDNSTSLTKNDYGNGTYYASASENSADAYLLFDGMSSSWLSTAQYGPGYSGATTTHMNDGTYITGEWVQIDMPMHVRATYYTLTPRSVDYLSTAPASWCLLGSDSRDSWYALGAFPQTNALWTSPALPFTVAIAGARPYRSYRWVFQSSTGTLVGLQAISIYGQLSTAMSVKDTNVVVYDRLGINTTTPAAALHVAGFSVLSGLKIVQGNASNITVPSNPGGTGSVSSNSQVIGYSNEPTGTSLSIPGNNSSYAFRFVTGSASNEVARINGLGNLGINTANPTEKLHIANGNAKFGSNAYVMNALSVGRSNPQAGLHVAVASLYDSNVTLCNTLRMVRSSNSYTSWSFSAEHNQTFVRAATAAGQGIQVDTGSQTAISDEPYYGAFPSAAALECRNTDVGTILFARNDGRVGIGTSNPTETLSVAGSFSLSNHGVSLIYTSNSCLGVGTSNPTKTLDVSGDLNLSGSLYKNGQLVPTSPWLVYGSAIYYGSNVGIGTSNALEALTVFSNIGISNYGKVVLWTSNSGLGINCSEPTDTLTVGGPSISFSNYGRTVLYSSNGNLGVGQDTPLFKLDVLGDLNISGSFYQGGLPYVSSQWTTSNGNIYILNGGVGIGNSNPTSKLHVTGDTTFEGHLLTAPDSTYDIGSAAASFRSVYLGASIVMSNTSVSAVPTSGALKVADRNTGALQRVIVNELQVGSVDNPLDSNVYLIKVAGGVLSAYNTTTGSDVPTSIVPNVYCSNGMVGVANSNPVRSLDVGGDINYSGELYRHGVLFQSSRWSCNVDGINVLSNVGIGGSNTAVDTLMVTGNIAISNADGSARIYTNANNLGIENPYASYTLDVGGDINYSGELYRHGVLFQSSRWSCNVDGIWSDSNVGIGIVPNPSNVLVVKDNITISNDTGACTLTMCNFFLGINQPNPQVALDVDGDINFTGTLYQNNSLFKTSQWVDDTNGIYVMSNVGIGTAPIGSNVLSVAGDISLDRGLLLRGIQISKNNGGMNNVTQQVINIPGVSNTPNNAYFYNGLYMNGLRLTAGTPSSSLLSVTYTPSNADSNLLISIPSSNATEAFRFISGSASNEVFTVTGTGRLGVGVSNPQTTLHVGGQSIGLSNSSNPYIVVQANSTGTSLMGVATTATVFSTDSLPGSYVIKNFTGGKVILQTGNGASAVCINTNNNVGIKNASAAYPLDVTGDINLTGTLRKNGAPYIGSQWSNVSSNIFVMGSNVAIGISNALEALHVSGKAYIDNQFLASNASSNAPSYSFLQNSNTGLYSPSINAVALVTGGVERLRVLANGNVGIGTSNASVPLEVSSTSPGSGLSVSCSNGDANVTIGCGNSTNSSVLLFTTSNGAKTGSVSMLVGGEMVYNSSNQHSWRVNGSDRLYLNPGASAFYPATDNALANGGGINRWTAVYATNGTVQTSDSQEKNYSALPYGLADLLSVDTIKYRWKHQDDLPDTDPQKSYEYYGVLADQVDTIFPELVYNQQRPYQLNYTELIPVCINAIKDLNGLLLASRSNTEAAVQAQQSLSLQASLLNASNAELSLSLAGSMAAQQSMASQVSALQLQVSHESQSNASLALSFAGSLQAQQSLASQVSSLQSQLSQESQSNAAMSLALQAASAAQLATASQLSLAQSQLSNLSGQIAASDNNKTYVDVLPPQGLATQEMAVVGIDRNGVITERFSESVHFAVASTGGRIAVRGCIALAQPLSGSPGDHVVPVLGPKDSIGLSCVQDYRVSFAEFRASLGRVVCGSTILLR